MCRVQKGGEIWASGKSVDDWASNWLQEQARILKFHTELPPIFHLLFPHPYAPGHLVGQFHPEPSPHDQGTRSSRVQQIHCKGMITWLLCCAPCQGHHQGAGVVQHTSSLAGLGCLEVGLASLVAFQSAGVDLLLCSQRKPLKSLGVQISAPGRAEIWEKVRSEIIPLHRSAEKGELEGDIEGPGSFPEQWISSAFMSSFPPRSCLVPAFFPC
jgi:hypothetical protein